MAAPNPAPVRQDNSGCTAIALIVLGVIVLAIIGKCSQPTDTNNLVSTTNYAADMGNAVAAQGPPPAPLPLDAPSMARGTAHMRAAYGAEGFSGAMIYSQNCYDALAHWFGWERLDRCGAFDALSTRAMANADMAGLDNEAAWFDEETAAARYLAAATAAGLAPAVADTRLSQLQARAARARLPAPPRATTDEANVADTDTVVDGRTDPQANKDGDNGE